MKDPKHLRTNTNLRCCLAQLPISLGHLQPNLDSGFAFLAELVHLMSAGRHGEVVLRSSDLRLP